MYGLNYGYPFDQQAQFFFPETFMVSFQATLGNLNSKHFEAIQPQVNVHNEPFVKLSESDECIAKVEENDNEAEPSAAILLTEDDLRSLSDVRKNYWSLEEDELLMKLTEECNFNWRSISSQIPNRNQNQCYGRYRRLARHFKRGWTKENDILLLSCIERFGMDWKLIAKQFQNYSSKQIRERYLNHLRPSIQFSDWTVEEDLLLCQLINTHGRKWKFFEIYLSGRSQNAIKNRYYGHLQRIQHQKSKMRRKTSQKKQTNKQS